MNKQNILLLHGGGGPATVAIIGAHLAERANVVAPTHPGWNGTPRLAGEYSIPALADEYLRLLETQDLRDVCVIGSSVGGWLGAEIALRDKAKRVAKLVILNGTGIEVQGHPIADIKGLTPPELAKLSFHDPAKLLAGAPPPTPESIAMRSANQASMMALAGGGFDPTLRARLGDIHIPTLVLWGASDRVVTADYGRAYAAAIAGARFELVADAGHLPQLEQPATTLRVIDDFALS